MLVLLNHSIRLAISGRFPEMLDACQQLMDSHPHDPNALLDVGVLLLNFGFLAKARLCFETARALAPQDLRPLINLANVAREFGDHAEASHLYHHLLGQLPDHPVSRVAMRRTSAKARSCRGGRPSFHWRTRKGAGRRSTPARFRAASKRRGGNC